MYDDPSLSEEELDLLIGYKDLDIECGSIDEPDEDELVRINERVDEVLTEINKENKSE